MDRIRPRTDADLDACAAVLVTVHERDGYPVEGAADPHAWLISDAMQQAWVAERGGSVVGHVAVSTPQDDDAAPGFWRRDHPDETVAVLGRLFVHPDARNGGLAAQLAEAAMDYAKNDGVRLVLDVMDKDQGAIRLYRRLGWAHIGDAMHAFGGGQHINALCFAAP